MHHVAIAEKGITPTRYWQTQLLGIPFQENMPDPTPVVAEFCHQHGIEVFGSLRMNDCHDAYGLPFEKLVYPLLTQCPPIECSPMQWDPAQAVRQQADGLAAEVLPKRGREILLKSYGCSHRPIGYNPGVQ